MGQIEQYLYRVAPLAQNGFISVHKLKEYTKRDGSIGKVFPGKACANWNEAIWIAQYYRDQGHDVYMSQGGQAKRGLTANGVYYPTGADRNGSNIWCLKSLRMDVDAKLYPSLEAMDTAVETFYSKTGIPKAPYAVRSGSGGYHLYWPFSRLVTPEEWQPLADALATAARSAGLNFDSECTVDRTRVLRIPGTRNYKDRNHPTEVEVYYDLGGDCTFEDYQQILAQWVRPGITASSYHADDGFEDERNMQEGRSFSPVDINLVRNECSFIEYTFNSGGADCSYDLWLLCIGLSCHTTNPHVVAHSLSNKYHAYEPTETTEKLKASQADRQKNKSLGPPSCATFQKHGAKQCATCKHRDRGSNPISIGYGRNGHAYTGITNVVSDLPNGYFRGQSNNFIYIRGFDEKGQPKDICVFMHEILPNSGRVEGRSPYVIVFNTKEGNDEKEIRITGGQLNDASAARRTFGDQGIPTKFKPQEQEFWLAFLDKLRNNVIKLPPMGWNTRSGEYGFSFNGKFISPSGEYPALSVDAEYQYGVLGNAQPWIDLSHNFITIHRLDLSVIVAASFAAPLVPFTGHNGVLIGVWSSATGAGKTTAMSLSQAVWGSPASMNGLNDTFAHLCAKAAMLKSLPLYHDEIKTQQQEIQFLKMAGQLTEGKEKGRAYRDGSLRTTKQWEMPIVYAGNRSMVNAADNNGGGSFADAARMLEFPCPEKRPTILGFDKIDRMRSSLKDNYGHVGQEYVKYLGQNRDVARLLVDKIEEDFIKRLGYQEGDRFWFAGATAITAGSYLARKLNLAPFDPASIRDYLVDVIINLRSRRKESQDYSLPAAVINELAAFCRHHRALRTVKTNIMLTGPGQPRKGEVEIIGDMPQKWQQHWPCVHISTGIRGNPDAPMLRFTDSSLTEWCRQQGKDKGSLMAGLKSIGASAGGARIGAGTRVALEMNTTERCWTLSISGLEMLERSIQQANGDAVDDATDDSD